MRSYIGLCIVSAMCFLPSRLLLAQQRDAALQPLAFLSGRWTSDAPDGLQEEYWSQPLGASMAGTFRIVDHGNPVFYEFWVIEVEQGKAIFKMKHFNHGLIGWEDKDGMVRLTASVSAEQDVLFSNPDGTLSLRYQRKGDDLVSTLKRVKDGAAKEQAFHLHRVAQ